MHGRKKLLMLAGMAGILACGACFLPPLPEHKPAPPLIRIGLDGVQSIRVEVANAAPSHHLDPRALEQRIAEAINEQSWKTKVNAHVGKEAGDGDAVLVITVLSETVATRPVEKTERMTFLVKDSATLTRLDGTLVWRENEAENWIERNIAEENAADAWNKPGLANDVDKALSDRLVFRLFHGR
jgi:hypothetical protein